MNELKLTNEEFKEYQYLSEGAEAILYYKDNVVLKKYDDIDQNAIDKIKIFNFLNLDNATNPKELVSIDNNTIAFTMDFKRGYYPISNAKFLSIAKRFDLLNKIKNILINFHKHNVIYGDLSIGNIITNDEDVYLCDIVNAMVDRHKFNSSSHAMRNYEEQNGKYDIYLDNYMLNILTIYLLNDIEYDDVLETIELTLINQFNNIYTNEIIGLTDNLECMNIGYNMLNPKNGVDDLLINHIDIEKYKEKAKS